VTGFSITVRAATQEDIDYLCANASVDEAAAVLIDDKVVAVTDEYGTATTRVEYGYLQQESVEKAVAAAIDVWAEATR
jgi:hypothetical protein